MYNCLYDCKYCFLQGMFNSAHYVIFTNFDDFFKEIKKKSESTNESCCFFSGYDCDSLAFEDYTGFINFFLDKFKNINNSVLEIRSKSTNIKSLLKFNPTPKIIPAFSLNSNEAINLLEDKTPKLSSRISAIKKLQESGWDVGLRFDPFIWINEKKKISLFFNKIFSDLNSKKIHSITIGKLRMPKGYFKKILKINPKDTFLLENYLRNNFKSLQEENELKKENLRQILSYFIDEKKIFLN